MSRIGVIGTGHVAAPMARHLAAKGQAGRLAEERHALATDGTLSLEMVQALRRGHAHEVLAAARDAIEKRLEQA